MPVTTYSCMIMVTATPSPLVHNDMDKIVEKKIV